MVSALGFLGTRFGLAASRATRIILLSELVIDFSKKILGEGSEEIPSKVQTLEYISVLVRALGDKFALHIQHILTTYTAEVAQITSNFSHR